MNVLLFLGFPLLTALFVLLSRSNQQVRVVALIGSLLQVVLALLLLFAFRVERGNNNAAQFLFEQQYPLIQSLNIHFHVGVDGISVSMILLTAFVVLAGVLVSWNIEKMTKEFYFLLILLALGAYGFFISLNLFVLFFFLEISVIPKYLLIGVWGSGKKEYSANKLVLMLMFGSALILVGMLGLYFVGGHEFDLVNLSRIIIEPARQTILFPLLFVGFGVFTALFPLHTWVPDGHSSAPTAGSMFLAGISMKLGGYGCLRVAVYLLPDGAKQYADIIILLSSIAILYGAFVTMMQRDLKYINAYSSISHVGFSLLAMGMLTQTAITGALMQMISHGLMTALFFAVIGMIYDRTHTRMVDEMGGLMKVMPFITTVLFIVGLCSLGLPGLSGFVAEMTVFVGSWQNDHIFHRIATISAAMSIVVTAVYILRAVARTAMGTITHPEFEELKDAHWNEKFAAMILLLGIISIGIAPGWLNDLLAPGAEIISNRIAGK